MAKKRQQPKSAFDNTSKEELSQVGKNILNKAEGKEVTPSPIPKKPVRKTKNKFIYVSEETHQQARIQAAQSNMNIKEYVTHLIERDGR
jgi:predicted HicB family RNase H-like nuclease